MEPTLRRLGAGEREAITLAEELHADGLILDDHAARRIAFLRKLPVVGTLGVLAEAAERGLVDFPRRYRPFAGDELLRFTGSPGPVARALRQEVAQR
jgi:hypothetical protein